MKIGEKQRTMLARYSVLSATGLRVCMRDFLCQTSECCTILPRGGGTDLERGYGHVPRS